MTPRPKNAQPGKVVELSPSQQAVIYGRGYVNLIKGDRLWRLDDREAVALTVLITEYQEARTGGSRSVRSSQETS